MRMMKFMMSTLFLMFILMGCSDNVANQERENITDSPTQVQNPAQGQVVYPNTK